MSKPVPACTSLRAGITGGFASRSSCADGTIKYVTSSCASLIFASTRADVSDSGTAEGHVGWYVSLTVSAKLRDAALENVLLMRLVPAAVGTRMLSNRG